MVHLEPGDANWEANRRGLLKNRALLLIAALSLAAAIVGGAAPVTAAGAAPVTAAGVTFTVNSTDNTGDGAHGDHICDTGPPGFPTGICTLRAAIEEANQTPDDTDTIAFNIPGGGVQTITPASALPTIAGPVIIDGYTQPGASPNTNPVGQGINAVLTIQLSGTFVGAGVDGLRITAGNTTVKGLVINDFYQSGDGIEFQQTGGNVVQGNFIGTNVTGMVTDPTPNTDCSGDEYGNGTKGIFLNNTASPNPPGDPNNTIGGTTPAARNRISGNGRGCSVASGAPTLDGINISGAAASGNLIVGNYIGANATGSSDDTATSTLGNTGDGIRIENSANNTIGGTSLAARNVIVGNHSDGIELTGSGATNNLIEGNMIGLDATGALDRGNSSNGVLLSGAPSNVIGGTAAGSRNVISGNGSQGVNINGAAAAGNVVEGNYIGTSITGTVGLGNDSDGVIINAAPGNTIGGTVAEARNVISGNSGRGVRVQGIGATGNLFQGNYIGTDVTGTLDFGNSNDGIFISGGGSNTIGGTTAGTRNIISGNNGNGIQITADGNLVQGNYIGVDVTGAARLGNGKPSLDTGDGVFINGAATNTIGGTAAGAGNVISSNVSEGIEIIDGASTGNVVQGNFIGTDLTGTVPLGNGKDGILLNAAKNTTVGGTASGARNIISANGARFLSNGVLVEGSGATGNQVQGNYIGTDVTGTVALGNSSDGVFVSGSPGVIIGGTTGPARNVISANGGRGVEIFGATATGVVVQGNMIGVGVTGTTALGNSADGVVVSGAPGNTIGGASAGAGNVVSANGAMGVEILDLGATGNVILGNHIGTDISGGANLGNVLYGVFINGAPGNSIGGTAAGARNVISGNDAGVFISGIGASGNVVQGNFVGTTASGTAALGNAFDGVRVGGSAGNNSIGGAAAGAANNIGFNGGNGVLIDSGTGNAILSNSIFSNTALGIDLGFDGVTPNDPGDPDIGANNLQNFPVLSAAQSSSFGTTVTGSLNSTASSTFTLQFFYESACDPSGNGEGRTFMGSLSRGTDGSGNASFGQTFPTIVGAGNWVTATATDAGGNTSEFSACIQVTGIAPPPLTQGDVDCSGQVNSIDALKLLRYVAGLDVTQNQPCPLIGTNLPPKLGDVDCSGQVNSVDALKVLRFVAGLTVSQNEPCPDIGQPLS